MSESEEFTLHDDSNNMVVNIVNIKKILSFIAMPP